MQEAAAGWNKGLWKEQKRASSSSGTIRSKNTREVTAGQIPRPGNKKKRKKILVEMK